MKLHYYKTAGGKNLILDYINGLSRDEKKDGAAVLDKLKHNKTDELIIKRWQSKILEVYFYKHNRIFYIVVEDTDIYLLHACQKQKNKTEKRDSDIVIKRAKEVSNLLYKNFIKEE